MAEFTVYTKELCPYCVQAKELLQAFDYQWDEIDLSDNEKRQSFYQQHNFSKKESTMPKIWHKDKLVGGYTELVDYLSNL